MAILTSDSERRALYHILQVRAKLADGRAYIVVVREMTSPPRGNFPTGSRSQIVSIRLSVNDWLLCLAHRYVGPDGEELTEPDPKYIQLDDVVFKQGA